MITLKIIIHLFVILTILMGIAIYKLYFNKKEKDTNLEDSKKQKEKFLIKYTTSPDNPFPIITKPAKKGDACIDLVAQRIIEEDDWRIKYGTGIFIELPDESYELQIRPRSSIFNYDLTLANSPGTVDSGYRGEIMIGFKKTKKKGNFYKPGDRVAQFKVDFVPKIHLKKAKTLSKTNRGSGGFGSTGIKAKAKDTSQTSN